MRGIAALLTVIFHVDLELGFGGNLLLKFEDSLLISRLYLMVDFFFVLSGFIMAHVYGASFNETIRASAFRQFTLARLARVYPLHLAMLLFTALIWAVSAAAGIPENPILQTENSAYSFITNLLLLHSMNLHNWFSWDHASWSISTEWWMYMLFPFLVRPFSRLKTWGRMAVVLGCFGGYLLITFWLFYLVKVTPALSFIFGNGPLPPGNTTINVAFQYGFVRCLCGFVLGMMMYEGYREGWGRAWLGNGYTLVALTLGLGVCMHLGLPDVFTVGFFPLIILSGAYGSPAIDRLFGCRPLQRLGDWSFSIYLVHQPLMYMLGSLIAWQSLGKPALPGPPPKPDILTGWLICLVFIAITLLVAALTYRLLEVPARQALNARFRRKAAIAINA